MTAVELATILLTVVFASIALYLSIKQRQAKEEIQKREEQEKQRLYQISILKEIQDRIGYSLDVEKIIDVITGSLRHLLPYSTASSFVIKNDKLVFRIYVEESVSSGFIEQVKKSMLASLQALVANLPEQIDEFMLGVPLENTKPTLVNSFFNIPLVIGNDVVGVINVSSTTKSLAEEDRVTILYQIVDQASNALLRLQDVLDTEKGKLTSMISSLADGVFMIDINKNLLIINDAARSFLNISSKNPSFTDILTSIGTQYNLLGKINESIKNNSGVEEKEITINNKIFQMFITPVPNVREEEKQKTIGASILFHDITIEKNINKIKEDFTHMMVHELRAPLAIIKDSSELMVEMSEEKGKLDYEEQKKLLKIIDRQSKNLLEQINQILDAAKIEAGRFSVNKVETDLGEIIKNSIDEFLPQAIKSQIAISADIFPTLPKVEVDPIRISQVLSNLLSNSLKFTPANGKITIAAKPDGKFLRISVSDTGMGIPESEQKDLFSKYYQIHTTPHELAKKGTGLGLYIVKGIVETHGGVVGVISAPGKGTTIYFTIPFENQAPRIIQEHFVQNQKPPQTASALVN